MSHMSQPFHKQFWNTCDNFQLASIFGSAILENLYEGVVAKIKLVLLFFLTYSLMELSLTVVSHIMNKIFTSFL